MTCIVGLVHEGLVYIGGDSAGVDGNYSLSVRQDRKVFRNGDFIMGFTSSFRMGQILAFNCNPPKPRVGVDTYAYMVTDFVDAARAALKAGGFVTTVNGEDKGGSFLVGYQGRLFAIHGDFQVAESTLGFDAVGCAHDVAKGHLYGSMHQPPETRVLEALKAAEALSGGVRGPFHVERLGEPKPVAPSPLPDVVFKVSGLYPAFDTSTTATMSGARQSEAQPDKPRRKRRPATRSKRK